MLIPKIQFVYSLTYDYNLRDNNTYKKYPSGLEIKYFFKKLEKEWKKHEKKILRELSKLTRLKWKEKTIKCYIVGKCTPFSDPLTIRVYENLNDAIDVLTHELIHQILIQNFDETKKYFDYIYKKYKKEPKTTRNHILVHAIHKNIYLKLFNEKRLKADISWSNTDKPYRRSWDIVDNLGHNKIINEFKNKIKKNESKYE